MKFKKILKLFSILFIIVAIISVGYISFNFRKVQFLYYSKIARDSEKLIHVVDKTIEENTDADWALSYKLTRYKYIKQNPEDEERLYKRLMDIYAKRIEMNPDDPENYLDRAGFNAGKNTFFPDMGMMGNPEIPWDLIIADVEKAVELDPEPNDPEVYSKRGVIYFSAGIYKKAISELTKYIQHDKKELNAYYMRARAYFEDDQYEKAVVDLKILNEKDPKTYKSIIPDWGYTYMAEGKYDKAVKAFNEVLKHNPNHRDTYWGRAGVYEKMYQYDEAVKDFTKVFELDNSWLSALIHRAWCYMKMDELDKALDDCNYVLSKETDNGEAYYYRGCVYGKKEEFDKVLFNLDMAAKYKPDWVVPYISKGQFYLEMKEYDKAIDSYDQALMKEPWNKKAYYCKAIACEEAGRLNNAVIAYKLYLEHSKPEEKSTRDFVNQRIKELE